MHLVQETQRSTLVLTRGLIRIWEYLYAHGSVYLGG